MGHGVRKRIYDQKFWWFCKLLYKLLIFLFEITFETTYITRFWYFIKLQWNGFDEVTQLNANVPNAKRD